MRAITAVAELNAQRGDGPPIATIARYTPSQTQTPGMYFGPEGESSRAKQITRRRNYLGHRPYRQDDQSNQANNGRGQRSHVPADRTPAARSRRNGRHADLYEPVAPVHVEVPGKHAEAPQHVRVGLVERDMDSQPAKQRRHHPVVLEQQAARLQNTQLRIADRITAFAGSMQFVYLHVFLFALWMLLVESSPWPTLTLIVSLEAIFLSTFVMIGQNRQSAFQQAKADHDFNEQELELKTNTELTRHIHVLTAELHRRFIDEPRP